MGWKEKAQKIQQLPHILNITHLIARIGCYSKIVSKVNIYMEFGANVDKIHSLNGKMGWMRVEGYNNNILISFACEKCSSISTIWF